ncbi:MAG TPA: hypothetical protein VN045_15380 [Microbacteriaceae bacterium]|nr:hypothetical protein [Microbacteriaceae bacterium]
MTIQTIANILIGFILVAWIVWRQLQWRIVSISRMWRLPLIIGIVGVAMLSQQKNIHLLSAVDVAVLVIELVISLGIGAVMGKIAVFRPRNIRPGDPGDPLNGRGSGRRDRFAGGDDRDRVERVLNADGTETVLESRTGWLGLALWIVMILVRIGIDAIASDMGSVLASATGVILVMVAANRLARTFVFAARVQKSTAVTA